MIYFVHTNSLPEPSHPIKRKIEEEPAIKIAQKILKTPGFVKGEESHSLHELGVKEEVQGNKQTRHAAIEMGLTCPHAFSPQVLRKASATKSKFYFTLQAKRIGHAFNLKGRVYLPNNNKQISLEGFCEAFTIPMLTTSFEEFGLQNRLIPWSYTFNILHQMKQTHCSDKTDENFIYLAANIRKGRFDEPICIASGYDWHATYVIFWGNYLIDCNRGFASGKNPGICVYKLTDMQLVTSKIVQSLVKRHDQNCEEFFNRKKIEEVLKAKLLHWQPMKRQRVGNCTYVNVKTGFLALMVIQYLLDHKARHRIPSLSNEEWQENFTLLFPIYKKWSVFDGHLVFREFKQDVEQAIEDLGQPHLLKKGKGTGLERATFQFYKAIFDIFIKCVTASKKTHDLLLEIRKLQIAINFAQMEVIDNGCKTYPNGQETAEKPGKEADHAHF